MGRDDGTGLTRHHLLKAALGCLVLGAPLLLSIPYTHISAQQEAVNTWPAVRGYVHNSSVDDVAKVKKAMFQLKHEWMPAVVYSYVWEGRNYTTDRVYYYGIHHPGGAKGHAERLVKKLFRPGKPCTVFVNPEAPREAILLRDPCFRPYGWWLVAVGGALLLMWYAIVEHNWEAVPYALEKPFPPAQPCTAYQNMMLAVSGEDVVGEPKDTERWYAVPVPYSLKGFKEMLLLLCIAVGWHAFGRYVWVLFSTVVPRSPSHGQELIVLYHLLGGLMVIRFVYYVGLVLKVREVEVAVSVPRLSMGSADPCFIRIAQRGRGLFAVTYRTVDVSLTLVETTYISKHSQQQQHQGRSRRSTKILGCTRCGILRNTTVPRGSAGFVGYAPFPVPLARVSQNALTDNDNVAGADRVYINWTMEVAIDIVGAPFAYKVSIPCSVDIPDEYRRKDD